MTVRDVVDHVANVEGAVHAGKIKDERGKALHAASRFYGRAGLPGAVSHVRLISRITVRGLYPLRNAVLATGAATWACVGPDRSVELRDEHRKDHGDPGLAR